MANTKDKIQFRVSKKYYKDYPEQYEKGATIIKVQEFGNDEIKSETEVKTGKTSKDFFLPEKTIENNYLLIIPYAKPGDSNPACKIGIPAGVHYEFNPGGAENIKVSHEDNGNKGNTFFEIPAMYPLWKLKLKCIASGGVRGPVDVEPPPNGPDFGPNYVNFLDSINDKYKGKGESGTLLEEFLKANETKPHKILNLKEVKKIKKERELIIEQAIALIDHIYVHLQRKESLHAVDPLQRLKLLKNRSLKSEENGKLVLSDEDFHREMMSIFTELRDLHTIYIPPPPYKDKIAFLPFLIEEFYDNGERKYMVSKVAADFKYAYKEGDKEDDKEDKDKKEIDKTLADASFEEEVIVTHWNGVPIEEAVKLNGDLNGGANEAARHARGLERMTIRPLNICFTPLENWIDITYVDKKNETKNMRFRWCVDEPKMGEKGRSGIDSKNKKNLTALCADCETEMVRRTKKALYSTAGTSNKNKAQPGEDDRGLISRELSEEFPDYFAYGKTKTGGYGYIRVYSFDVDDADAFVDEFGEIVKELEKLSVKDGLIIDVRGNGGGFVTAAEKLLEALTREKIEPMRFQLLNSPLTLKLCQNDTNNDLGIQQWGESIAYSIEHEIDFSPAKRLLEEGEYKGTKGVGKFNKFVLITDALCYSATEIFAAGFKDNKLGKILGVHETTGGGGACVLTHEDLIDYLYDTLGKNTWAKGNSLIKPLPENGCDFRVAVCRAIRVGEKTGIQIEDVGVKADYTYEMGRDDLKRESYNNGLIKKAEEILKEISCQDGKPVGENNVILK